MTAPVSMIIVLGDAGVAWPAWRDEDLIALLLVLLLGVALGMCLAGLMLVLHFIRLKRLERTSHSPGRPSLLRSRSQRESSASTPIRLLSRWVAIRQTTPGEVQAALGLHHCAPCSWQEGLSAAREQKLFISPPIGDWVLVFGSLLPDPAEDVDICYRFVLELSRRLGQVQFFSANRLLHHHAWAWAEHGRVQRAYAWAGRTLWNQGPKTRPELELGLRCFDYAELPERAAPGRPDPVIVATELLGSLAARWSVDPAALDDRRLRESHGIAGAFSRSKIH